MCVCLLCSFVFLCMYVFFVCIEKVIYRRAQAEEAQKMHTYIHKYIHTYIHTHRRAQAEEAQKMLEQGSGVALTASCYEADLPAWGEVEVRIDVYSDMAGLFRDKLEVRRVCVCVYTYIQQACLETSWR